MTKVHTFKVTMVIEIIADDRQQARKQLDQQGGHVSQREVELVNTTPIPAVDMQTTQES